MTNKIKNKFTNGQAALILILLTAAALIFLAITLNWGRIAQEKSMLSIAAYQAASTLASDAASYGEMSKLTYLNNTNSQTSAGGLLMAFLTLLVAVIVIIAFPPAGAFLTALAIASVVMAVANFVLQAVVVQPGITALWNKLQQDQPTVQQFEEGGIGTALQGIVGDQVNIKDYLDWNANGVFGNSLPKDTVSRFAVYYTERLKMLNNALPINPKVKFFYDQLGEFVNGETCGQSQSDNYNYGIPVDAACQSANVNAFINNTPGAACTPQTCTTSRINCVNNPADPVCVTKMPNTFQLSDACSLNADPSQYNPYCDPCCQPVSVPNPGGKPDPKPLRPLSCLSDAQCANNNPYVLKKYLDIYDPAYQNYKDQVSFLAQFGRDQQMGPFSKTLTLQGDFPNGIYPYFWEMNYYSPRVDNIDPTRIPLTASSPSLHWCAPTNKNGVIIPTFNAPSGFPGLAQLALTYSCSGKDCCVNFLPSAIVGAGPSSSNTSNGPIDMVEDLSPPLPAPYGASPLIGSWAPGDNQFCSASPPYNGSDVVFNNGTSNQEGPMVDGTCEWTGDTTTKPPQSPTSFTPGPSPPASTIDGLDNTMHTLSDFLNFANTVLNQDVAKLSGDLSSWYPQAAGWIAPACNGSAATGTDPNTGVGGCTLLTNPNCDISSSSNNTAGCNQGSQDGRLLSIYNPANGGINLLQNWDTAITAWLNNNYTPSSIASPWCLPQETAAGLLGSSEDLYIKRNGSMGIDKITKQSCTVISDPNCVVTTPAWGSDLPHVIACLNYNAGPTADQRAATNYANFNTCLTTLTAMNAAGTCPSTATQPLCTPGNNSCLPPNCLATVLGSTGPSYVGDGHDCDPNYVTAGGVGSFANWVSNNVNFGPVYNYQQCFNALSTGTCPAALPRQCSPAILGRSLLSPTANASPNNYDGCSGKYMQWITNSLALAKDEAPKFALRYLFLKDVYTRAVTMQNIFRQGEMALFKFLCIPGKTLTLSPGNIITCPAVGGPAFQLTQARTEKPVSQALPNSVIYGWIDRTLPNGQTLKGNPSGAGGYAHLVKVTAFSPGRNGNKVGVSTFMQSALPWIQTSSSLFSRTYALVQRDGYVFVRVRRWDQDHSAAVAFPNKHALWQFTYHRPGSTTASANVGSLIASCFSHGTAGYGFGLMSNTALNGLSVAGIQQADQEALAYAFMLNDEGTGDVDTSVKNSGTYNTCLSQANILLQQGIFSEACAMYIASSPGSSPGSVKNGSSQNGDHDYSLKFVDCKSIPGYKTLQEDMTGN